MLFCNVATYTDVVANRVMSAMRYEGYEVDGVKLPSGEWDISIKRGICLELYWDYKQL